MATKASKKQQNQDTATPAAEAWPPSHERMTDLITRSQHGDKKAWSELKPLLERLPDWEMIYDTPASLARRNLIASVAKDNYFLQEVWQRRTASLQKEIEGPNPTALERTLCARVALCWLAVNIAQLEATVVSEGATLTKAAFYDQQLDRAHKRYLSAVEALAKVRRLLRPGPLVAQMNIAQPGAQQLNIAAPAPTDAPAIAEAIPTIPTP